MTERSAPHWLIPVGVALLVGLFLAILSVPAAAFVSQRWGAFASSTPPPRYETIVRLRDGELYRVTDRRAERRPPPGWLRPYRVRSSERVPAGSDLARFLDEFHHEPVADPRPLFLRPPPPPGYHEAVGVSAGWPWHAGHSRTDIDLTVGANRIKRRGAWTVTIGGRDHTIPFYPHWPGLLLNTAFYGALALLSWAALRTARSARRRKHGACAACGYPLDDRMSRCPECGVAPPTNRSGTR